MRKYIIVIIALFYCFISVNIPSAYADNWLQKADFGGTARYCAVGFNIGSKGYLGTGYNGSSSYKDFWEYDSVGDSWTQKADFEGTARYVAVGFSIGSMGYLGTGYDDSSYYKDFWEYDPSKNTWTQKADFAGTARGAAVGFSIGSMGYIGTGFAGAGLGMYNDFWEYNPSTDSWTQKADFAGTARVEAAGLSVGSKGYLGTGHTVSAYVKDFWEYNPSTNSWTQKTDFPGTARYGAVGFSIGSKGYLGTGYDGSSYYKNFWEYDPSKDTWNQKNDFSGKTRASAVGFAIGSKGYIGTGNNGSSYYRDFWVYDPSDELKLVDQTGVEINQTITSNIITVSWISSATTISIIGGKYSINGGTYTSASGKVNQGNTVTVQLISSAYYDAEADAILTIGDKTDTFAVKTRTANTKPNQFTFTDQIEVPPDTVITSDPITISGIEAATSIAITGGTYSINGGAYSSDGGTVNNGDTVTVQVTSSSDRITTTDAVLTVGGVSDTFSVKTRFVLANVDSGPCFIATAAFGSPLAGQVEILRKFRDRYLLTNAWGKKFVAWYYRNGPAAAVYINDKPLAKAAVRVALYPLIGFSILLISGYLPFVIVLFLLSALLFLRLRPKKLDAL
jgi:hypothetical protein